MDKLQNTENRQQVNEYWKWTMYTVQNTGNGQITKRRKGINSEMHEMDNVQNTVN